MSVIRKIIIKRNRRVIKSNNNKIARNQEIIQGTRRGRVRKARKAW